MKRYPSLPRSQRNARRSPHSKPLPPSFGTVPESSAPGLQMSSRSLDMCLLAVCSCALSLMCHQTSGFLNLPSVTSTSAMNSSSNAPAQVDFMVKAGLVTSRQESTESEEDA